jgi:outer membrane protein assembly factor BamE (lipoprotein component of BamABCDE complex)
MLNRIALMALLGLLAVGLYSGCTAQDKDTEMAYQSKDQAADRASWSRLSKGMTPDEVLSVLGQPTGMRVEMMFTYWEYSTRGTGGPHVQFDTKTMTVQRWREP